MTKRPRSAIADLRTSEVLRRAATLLRPGILEARIVALELEVRATWIERARVDEGVSEERRLGVAAIEDAPERS